MVATLIRPAALLVVLVLSLMACSTEGNVDEVASNDTTTHDVGIPPCTPVEGSILDPCRPNIRPLISNPNAHRMVPGTNPISVRWFLEGGGKNSASHVVVRATYLPKSVRCVIKDKYRSAGYVGLGVWDRKDIQCFIDIRANEYVLGTGPDVLTVSFGTNLPASPYDDDIENDRRRLERAYTVGGRGGDFVEVVAGGLPGRESILFLGPASNYLIEAWEIFVEWDVQRKDGVVRAIHPFAGYWNRYGTDGQKAKTELTLPAFAAAVTEANNARKIANGGRVRPETNTPMIIASANASDLHQHHVDAGNTAHAAGPPVAPPPPCGKAVANQVSNPGLMLDCFALLEAKDELRGTGSLNWSVDVAMGRWDGVTTGESAAGVSGASGSTGSQVTKVELVNKGLTGSVPASLAELDLEVLKLSGNSLTGCIPAKLRSVATNDLDTLNLLYCDPGAPEPILGEVTKTSVAVSWTALEGASVYRVEYVKDLGGETWIVADSAITATSYTVIDLDCGEEYLFRLSAKGSGTGVRAEWSDPSPNLEVETAACASDVVDRYDANGDGVIDYSERQEALKDYNEGKISYSEFLEVIRAYLATSG